MPFESSKLFSTIKYICPILRDKYNKKTLIADVKSALTITFVLIPQAIAFSRLAGVDPMQALVSAVFPLLVYGIVGGSKHLSVGPEALSSVLVGLAVFRELEIGGNLADADLARNVANLLAFLVGLFAILMAILRISFFDNILSGYFLTGFILGIANLIMVEQLPSLLGIKLVRDHSESTFQLLIKIIEACGNVRASAAGWGVFALSFLLIVQYLKKQSSNAYVKSIPEILVLVIISIVTSYTLDFSKIGISTLGSFSSRLPTPSLPHLNPQMILRLLPDVLVITIVGFIESQSVTRCFGLKKDYFPSSERELLALGAANAVGSCFGTYPTFGSLPRSRILFSSGGQTLMAGLMAACFVLIVFTTLGNVLQYLPLGTLGAIVMMAAIHLIPINEIQYLFKMKYWRDMATFIVIWITTIFIPINNGIWICIGFAGLFIVSRTTAVKLSLLGKINYMGHNNKERVLFVDVRDYPNAKLVPGFLILSVRGSLEFYNVSNFRRKIEQYLQAGQFAREYHHTQQPMRSLSLRGRETMQYVGDEENTAIILDFTHCEFVDSAACYKLLKIISHFKQQGVHISFSGLRPALEEIFKASGVQQELGSDHLYHTVEEAILHAKDYHSVNLEI